MIDINSCEFSGQIISPPVLNQDDPFNVTLDIRLKCDSCMTDILLHSTGYQALSIYSQIAVNDKIYVKAIYSPAPVPTANNVMIPRFQITYLVITEKKIPNIKLSFK